MNTIEIELRYEILNPLQLTSFVMPFKQLHCKHDIDIYFDTKDALLYQKGIFIRNRNDKKLEIKFNRACLDNPELAIQDYCEEHVFALPLQETDLERLNNLLQSLALQSIQKADFSLLKSNNYLVEHYIIDKTRTSYAYNEFTIAIDEVVDLGTFLEIECMTKSVDDLEAIKKEMEFLLSNLALKPLRTGYGTLLLRKKDFQHYLLGRFILAEDKIHRVVQ